MTKLYQQIGQEIRKSKFHNKMLKLSAHIIVRTAEYVVSTTRVNMMQDFRKSYRVARMHRYICTSVMKFCFNLIIGCAQNRAFHYCHYRYSQTHMSTKLNEITRNQTAKQALIIYNLYLPGFGDSRGSSRCSSETFPGYPYCAHCIS